MKTRRSMDSSNDRNSKLQVVTAESLHADKKAATAKEKARRAKARLKAAKREFKLAKHEYKLVKKLAKKAAKAAIRAQKALQGILDKIARQRSKAGLHSARPKRSHAVALAAKANSDRRHTLHDKAS